jgi:hypothetical protein
VDGADQGATSSTDGSHDPKRVKREQARNYVKQKRLEIQQNDPVKYEQLKEKNRIRRREKLKEIREDPMRFAANSTVKRCSFIFFFFFCFSSFSFLFPSLFVSCQYARILPICDVSDYIFFSSSAFHFFVGLEKIGKWFCCKQIRNL